MDNLEVWFNIKLNKMYLYIPLYHTDTPQYKSAAVS